MKECYFLYFNNLGTRYYLDFHNNLVPFFDMAAFCKNIRTALILKEEFEYKTDYACDLEIGTCYRCQ